ncbi:MAG: bifunctional riboflavin kinase/FMN adenylyltransferase [Ruminococcaceae bacterium]|nr:bifunctional riboflavin kinase/FMN adenylyltransferase [Oscillospiraceae bacterium]
MSLHLREISPVFLDLRGGHIKPMPRPVLPMIVCLGNFDGVHLAHAALFEAGRTLRDRAFPEGLCGVFTFFHPSSDYFPEEPCAVDSPKGSSLPSILQKTTQQRHLTTLKEKLRLMARHGIDFACLCDFPRISSLSPEAFLGLLTDKLMIRGAVCGYNFHFGAGGLGSSETLQAHFDRPDAGRACVVAPPFCLDGDTVSSTRIRKLLTEGHADVALRHLGHPYTLEAKVVKGKQLGRKLGFPTANQYFLPESLVPAHGVYAVLCSTPAGIFPGVANVGSHPTVDTHAAVNCETYIIGPAQDLYGYRMRVAFLSRLRAEERFSSVEALTKAIRRDAAAAEAYVKGLIKDTSPWGSL